MTLPIGVGSAEVVLPCDDLQATAEFFTGELGFRLECIMPADDPRVAIVSRDGMRVCLDRTSKSPPGVLRLRVDERFESMIAPNGTVVERAPVVSEYELPELAPELVVVEQHGVDAWIDGRAGMRYRDLIPGRQGGRYIASHIAIPEGGPVPDYVHFHAVVFQLIYCYRGRVRVVYEGQGEPFWLEPGDCVLQPPRIRHRVLECSDGLEVVEMGCPAEHPTFVEHELELPTELERPAREFYGQRFVHHEANGALWEACVDRPGFEQRDLGVRAATRGVVVARVIRASGSAEADLQPHAFDTLFGFVLSGTVQLLVDGAASRSLGAGAAWTIPAGVPYGLGSASDDFECLLVEPRQFNASSTDA